MQGAQGHSRKESDDFSKLIFGDDSENLDFDGELNFQIDPASMELSLSFQQPKSIRQISTRFLRQILWSKRDIFKLYVHPVGASLFLLLAIVIPVLLAYKVVHHDYKEKGEYLIIDKSFDSFQIPGHISSQHKDMVDVASKHSKQTGVPLRTSRRKRSAAMPDIFPTKKAPEYQKNPKWTLELVYLATGEDDSDLNVFTKERLETIHQVEQSLMQQENFPDFCWKWVEAQKDRFLPNGCTPPISLIDFFFPSVLGELRIFDGQGKGLGERNLTEESISRSLDLLLTKQFTYWFVDDKFSKDNRKSRFLRAEIKFGYPLKWKYGHNKRAQNKAFNTFLVKYVEAVKKMSTDKVRVLYGGTEIFDYEVNKTLWADIKLSIFTVAFVFAFVFIFTRLSPFLTFFGIISILTPLCFAYFLFRVPFDVNSLGILSGMSVFIIIGIGVDDVFVFINTFRQAHGAKSLEARMAHTLTTAGKATFFTSFTTTAAFAANCLSKMPAIHDFGLFMALIVSCCWVTVFAIIPPVLNLWHRYIAEYEEVVFNHLCGWASNLFGSGRSSLPDEIVQFLSGNNQTCPTNQSSSTTSVEFELSSRTPTQDDDDSLLVQLNSSPPNSQTPSPSSSDADLAMYDDPNGTFDLQMAPLMRSRSSQSRTEVRESDQHNRGCICNGGLQGFLYHRLGVPIKRYPIVVVVSFGIILVASIALDSQIRASTKPPAFFKESTNLQQLLYLKYNMSSDNLNVMDLSWDLIGNNNRQSNNIDNPTMQSTTTETEGNGMKSSTPTHGPATALQPAKPPKTSHVQKQSDPTKSTTTKPTTQRTSSTTTPTPAAQTASSSKASTRSTRKPAVTSRKPTKRKTRKTKPPTQPPKTAKRKTQKTKPPTQPPKTGDSRITTLPATGTPPPECPSGCTAVDRPIVDTAATVYVIFGLKAIDRSKITREHVIEEKGDVIPDYDFTDLLLNEFNKFLKYACRLCHRLSTNKDLVRAGGADCFPSWITDYINKPQYKRDDWNKECLKIKPPSFSTGKSRAKLMKMPSKDRSRGNNTYWMKMAFESTIFMGKSSREKVKDFDNWNKFLEQELESYPKGLKTAFQTSDEWVITFMEVIAVNSAIYGIALSLVLCLGSVAIFTANFLLTLIVMITILSVLSTVVAIFYLASWQLGAVEAISLSVLVGTSVDYCVHIVEGYIMAGNAIPANLNTAKEIRGWRSLAALSHIGTAILSSAITTIVGSVPLCLTTILLFAKFGQILAINTAVSIFFTLTICVALLCLMSPAKFRGSWQASLKAVAAVAAIFSVGLVILFVINWKVTTIPGPAGEPLFPKP